VATGYYSYLNCNGDIITSFAVLSNSVIETECIAFGEINWISGGSGIVSPNVGICGNVCIPSPTPSKTPTRTPTPTVTKTPTVTPTRTPTPTQTVFSYLGRSNPDAINAAGACSTYTTTRAYYSTKPLASLTNGDIIYENFGLSIPTNGNQKWIALTVGGVGTKRPIKINTNGSIMDSYYCL
jgi:hypothetical protein